MVQWDVLWQYAWDEFLALLNAPRIVPEMWWIITPLLVAFLVMTFYFGLYRREELGWNTALGNTIVLLFVAIDLLRTVYHYTFPPSLANFGLHPIKFIIIFIIILEATLLFYSAFTHFLPKRLMFFLASPLPVNLQAYVIVSIVYLRVEPTWTTLLGALLLFAVLFVVARTLQLFQRILVERGHRRKITDAQDFRQRARSLRLKAKKLKGKAVEEAREKARIMLDEAKALEQEVIVAEEREHGELRAAKSVARRKS